MTSHYVPSIILVVSRFTNGNLLGGGKGLGSCAAYPFRSYDVHWSLGCPHHASCCSEFGYCRPKVGRNNFTLCINYNFVCFRKNGIMEILGIAMESVMGLPSLQMCY